MSFIFSILIFIFFIGLFIVLALFGFIRSIFSFGKKKKNLYNEPSQPFGQPNEKRKIFDSKEGEYVDFEEIESDKE